MSITTKLYVDDKVFNVLRYKLHFNQPSNDTGRPSGKVTGGLWDFYIEATKDSFFLEWALTKSTMKNVKIVQSPTFMSGKSKTIELYDVHCVKTSDDYNDDGINPMTMHVTLSPAILAVNGTILQEKEWKVSSILPEAKAEQVTEQAEPEIVSLDWLNYNTKEKLETTTYKTSLILATKIKNPSGNAVNITITKKNGTDFEQGKKELVFSEILDDDGNLELALEIKENWEILAKSTKDELIAKVTHSGINKKSEPLPLLPGPKVLVNFRPNKKWKGEFGFDWIRKNDTKLFKDEAFEKIISKQYEDKTCTTLETDINAHDGYFKQDLKQFQQLKDKYYNPFEIEWRKVKDTNGNKVNDKHYTEWLSLKKGREAKVNLVIDVTEKADFLEFDQNENFTITPNKINIKNKKGVKMLNNTITIKCDSEFPTDQEITIKAYKKDLPDNGKLAGKITVWANNASKQKQQKVVFVQVTTKISKKASINTPDASAEKTRINKYLEQAYIELHPDSVIIDLDLRSDQLLAKLIKNNRVAKKHFIPATYFTTETKIDLVKSVLIPRLIKQYPQYAGNDFFKAFYFDEKGSRNNNPVSGYASHKYNSVIVFKTANDQTAAHEFLHTFNLPHTFANNEADSNAEFTYKAKMTDNLLDYSHSLKGRNKNRCSLYYWQWVKANNSIMRA